MEKILHTTSRQTGYINILKIASLTVIIRMTGCFLRRRSCFILYSSNIQEKGSIPGSHQLTTCQRYWSRKTGHFRKRLHYTRATHNIRFMFNQERNLTCCTVHFLQITKIIKGAGEDSHRVSGWWLVALRNDTLLWVLFWVHPKLNLSIHWDIMLLLWNSNLRERR